MSLDTLTLCIFKGTDSYLHNPMLLIFTLCWSSQKMKEPSVGVPAKKA